MKQNVVAEIGSILVQNSWGPDQKFDTLERFVHGYRTIIDQDGYSSVFIRIEDRRPPFTDDPVYYLVVRGTRIETDYEYQERVYAQQEREKRLKAKEDRDYQRYQELQKKLEESGCSLNEVVEYQILLDKFDHTEERKAMKHLFKTRNSEA